MAVEGSNIQKDLNPLATEEPEFQQPAVERGERRRPGLPSRNM